MIEKIKKDIDRLLLVLTMKKKNPIYFGKIEVFLFLIPKVVYLYPFSFSLLFPKV